jgi:hypothetical protein
MMPSEVQETFGEDGKSLKSADEGRAASSRLTSTSSPTDFR